MWQSKSKREYQSGKEGIKHESITKASSILCPLDTHKDTTYWASHCTRHTTKHINKENECTKCWKPGTPCKICWGRPLIGEEEFSASNGSDHHTALYHLLRHSSYASGICHIIHSRPSSIAMGGILLYCSGLGWELDQDSWTMSLRLCAFL